MTVMDEQQIQFEVNLEYMLQISAHLDCWCSRYLTKRKGVLIPELVQRIQNQGPDFDGDACQFVHNFVKRLHENKCPTEPQPEPYMDLLIRKIDHEIRDTIGEDPEPEEYPDGTLLEERKPPWGLPRWPLA